MRIGLIDVDSHNYPNLVQMKLSAWHKAQGDHVEWYQPLISGHMDKVYMSKVFSFSQDYPYPIDADEVIKGGSGYHIKLVDGKETWIGDSESLPDEIEHTCPDTSLYGIKDTAYGFLTRGCPRGCEFCHVVAKEGRCSRKVADVEEFWGGQKYIELLDPNILACRDRDELLNQLAETGAKVNFNQGMDARLMTEEIAEKVGRMTRSVTFAWDGYKDEDRILEGIKTYKRVTGHNRSRISVYVLCNFNTPFDYDVHRVETLKALDVTPYVMLYDKEHIPRGDRLKKLQRYSNNRWITFACKTFDEYNKRGVE